MKVIDIALLNSSTRADFIRVQRADGQVFGFTTCDVQPEIDGVTYGQGMDISVVEQTLDLAANNGEVYFLPGGVVTVADLLAGVWNNFTYVHFETDWVTPNDVAPNIKSVGFAGEVMAKDGRYTAETRGLKQALRNPQGFATQVTCRARFADYPAPTKDNVRCMLDAADWQVTGEITTATSRRQVADAARTEADDWFGLGIFESTSGDNAGRARTITAYAAGVFTFDRPFDFDFVAGDTYQALAGCRKRHERTTDNPAGLSDCLDKFDNVPNFQGEPHTPGVDAMTQGAGDV